MYLVRSACKLFQRGNGWWQIIPTWNTTRKNHDDTLIPKTIWPGPEWINIPCVRVCVTMCNCQKLLSTCASVAIGCVLPMPNRTEARIPHSAPTSRIFDQLHVVLLVSVEDSRLFGRSLPQFSSASKNGAYQMLPERYPGDYKRHSYRKYYSY